MARLAVLGYRTSRLIGTFRAACATQCPSIHKKVTLYGEGMSCGRGIVPLATKTSFERGL
jgi:hypothetical protein